MTAIPQRNYFTGPEEQRLWAEYVAFLLDKNIPSGALFIPMQNTGGSECAQVYIRSADWWKRSIDIVRHMATLSFKWTWLNSFARADQYHEHNYRISVRYSGPERTNAVDLPRFQIGVHGAVNGNPDVIIAIGTGILLEQGRRWHLQWDYLNEDILTSRHPVVVSGRLCDLSEEEAMRPDEFFDDLTTKAMFTNIMLKRMTVFEALHKVAHEYGYKITSNIDIEEES
jgi:hypothetical protein